MLPKYDAAGKYELPKLLELQETPMNLAPDAKTILQPKYDGCQAIFIPVDNAGSVMYVPVTRKGNVITRLLKEAAELTETSKGLPATVVFSEYEPVPWSDNNKAKLAGNLYNQDKLEFSSRLIAFDAMSAEEFYQGKMRATENKPRLENLDRIKEKLGPIQVAPWVELPYKDALEACKSSRIETEEGTRCRVLGILCEGGVIRHGMKGQKEKPTIDKDIAVLTAIKSPKGQLGWVAVDTKNPTADGLMLVYGGVTAENHTSLVDKVVEVKMLTVSGFKAAGNPTFVRTREHEKEANCNALRSSLKQPLQAFYKASKVTPINTPDFDR